MAFSFNKYFIKTAVFVLSLLSSSGGFSATEDGQALKNPTSQIRYKCNLRRDGVPPQVLEKLLQHPAAKRGKATAEALKRTSAPLPPSYDMRTAIGGVDKAAEIFPVYDQAGLGSCTANASAGALQYLSILQGVRPNAPSRLFIYYNERARILGWDPTQDTGAFVSTSVLAIAEYGACYETSWPYSDVSYGPSPLFFSQQPNDPCYSAGLSNVALAYGPVPQDLDTIKQYLSRNVPVLIGLLVYNSFWSSLWNGGVVPIPDPANESLNGGHELMLVGYDDVSRRFTARNSWGTWNGNKGYYSMPYDYVASPYLCFDFWFISSSGANINVNFSVTANTVWGQNIYLVGDIPELGNWDINQALRLTCPNYPNWTGSRTIAASKPIINYKYIKKDAKGKVIWMSGDNLSFSPTTSPQNLTPDEWKN
ncbi:carbohydrate-binding module family 20 domain-containing protein [Candidatus Finniella inopinata]|uniref:CBM20 domain-containing protein n=1 Tax=Candidatus Finniella inopinata TaxID=1696036 RepID=A0A4Q7DGM9_9PROT|nr:carbohydrate-binding module family 20 domain-containing protein [Candidatus Finniella inopinata]RZI46041.1 hypothetical protein EQU50_03665 [Candidatus Finniella inopinata]